ncbi:MAG: Phospholipase C precursor [Firmicutes bacterium ADurb.Bin419]|nr:MAG: Phospholipase C precursor [Firmicutes bacterium ADurb.Bin419]
MQFQKHSISLRSCNGQYLCAEDGGGREIVANRTNRDVWETFSVANADGSNLKSGDSITLSTHNNYFVCAENGGGCEIVANRTEAKEWEHFIIQKVTGSGEIKPGDKVTLRCCNNMYVCAENGGGSTVVGNRSNADIWETFTIEFLNPPVSASYYAAPVYPRGLRHARVEIETKKNAHFYDTNGTDDNVYFAIILRNGRTYEIRMDKSGYNDFENGRRDSYNMDLPETIYLQDIVEFRLRKDYINISDDWQPNWIRVYDDANNEIFYRSINKMIKGRTPYTMAANLPVGSNQVSVDPSIISFLYSLDGKGHDSSNPTSYLPWEPFPFYSNDQLRRRVYSNLFEKTCEENLTSIRLKSHNQQYVSVIDDNQVRVDKNVPGMSETFIISTQKVGPLVSGDAIQLFASNGHYLCAEGNGGREIVANRDIPGSWETFIIQKTGDNSQIKNGDKITLRCSGSQYVCAENGGGDILVANRTNADVWETFIIEFTETTILPSPKPNEINKLTSWAGFEYDQRQGIFYSKIDCWQRDLGYFPIYDTAAPLAGMFIHSDPICFNYDHKEWKIELWKGQYGICTGAEVGIYVGEFQINTPYRNFNDRINAIIDFRKNTACAPDEFMLEMSFDLMRNGQFVFNRNSDKPKTREKDKHWWLTGFKPGVFSNASDLSMRIHIVFPTKDMMKAFWDAVIALGYPDIHADETKFTVDFTFNDPKTPQPWPSLT